MKISIETDQLRILLEPDSTLETVYIEHVLGLKENGDSITLYRHNYMGEDKIAYLSTERPF